MTAIQKKGIKRAMTIQDNLKETGESGFVTYLVTNPPIKEIREKLVTLSENGVELTVTFHPTLQDAYTPATLTQLVREHIAKVQKRHPTLRLILVGEYSEVGMYHMHGSLLAEPRAVNALKRRLTQQVGRTEIKMIKYTESWVDYVLKKDNNQVGTKNIEYKEILKEEYIDF